MKYVHLVDSKSNQPIQGELKAPFLQVKGIDLYRIELNHSHGMGYLDFSFEGQSFFIQEMENQNRQIRYVGKNLVLYAQDFARKKGCQFLEVNAINNSHGFYTKMGFIPEEDARGYPLYGTLCHSVTLTLSKEMVFDVKVQKAETYQLARRLLAHFFNKPLHEIDPCFVSKYFWWDLQSQPLEKKNRLKDLIEMLVQEAKDTGRFPNTSILGEVKMRLDLAK
ncbi:MAG: hypothetical protein WDZ28_00805 [Simkaniaceae bacterium]